MDKAHDIQKIVFSGSTMILHVDGKKYEVNIADHSECLAAATQQQRDHFEVSASGYGIHWPALDEDLSIDGLIGVKPMPSSAKIAT